MKISLITIHLNIAPLSRFVRTNCGTLKKKKKYILVSLCNKHLRFPEIKMILLLILADHLVHSWTNLIASVSLARPHVAAVAGNQPEGQTHNKYIRQCMGNVEECWLAEFF